MGHINYMESFYRYFRQKNIADIADKEYGSTICNDIIARCRLLRNIEYDLALRMIGAMYLSLSEIVQKEQSNLVISSLVDFFVPDVLQRIIESRDGRFLGIARSIIPGRVLITARGEYNRVNDPSDPEINDILTKIVNPTFAPTVKTDVRYNFPLFLKKKLRWEARWLWFDILRFLKKDYFNPELMITRKPGDDYYMTIRDWYEVESAINKNWEDFLEQSSCEKRVFIGLQYYPECTTDYWIKDPGLANWVESLEVLCEVLTSQDYTIFIKDHPVTYGLRKPKFLRQIRDNQNIVFVPYEVTSQALMKACKIVFTWTGTIGMQSAMAGNCTIMTSSYYSNSHDFIALKSMEDIYNLPSLIDNFELNHSLEIVQTRISKTIGESSVLGNIILSGFSSQMEQHCQDAKTLANSLDNILTYYV